MGKENGTRRLILSNISISEKDTDNNQTTIVSVLQFMVVKQEFVISGVVSQWFIQNRIVNEPSEFTKDKLNIWQRLY